MYVFRCLDLMMLGHRLAQKVILCQFNAFFSQN